MNTVGLEFVLNGHFQLLHNLHVFFSHVLGNVLRKAFCACCYVLLVASNHLAFGSGDDALGKGCVWRFAQDANGIEPGDARRYATQAHHAWPRVALKVCPQSRDQHIYAYSATTR